MTDPNGAAAGPARIRRLTAGLAGIAGAIRRSPDDFLVDEVPLYGPCGRGDHVLFLVEKRGISTFEALLWLSKAVKVSEHLIGYAGLKDAHAVTRQWMSVSRVPPERLLAVRHPRVRVLEAGRHSGRIRIGHLRGNRFTIRIRGARMENLPAAREAFSVLARRGVPNAYGVQRFGVKQDGHEMGRAVLAGDMPTFFSHLLGRPDRAEGDERVRAAREAYDRGDLAEALRLFPGKHRIQKKALSAMIRTGSLDDAWDALGKRPRRIYVSAYQSWLFNRCLDARLEAGTHDRLLAGDLAWLHGSGALFRVEDPDAEAGRAARFEASPTGPLPGYDLRRPSGGPLAAEEAVLAPEALAEERFLDPRVRIRGSRRPYRVPLRDASLDVEGQDVVVARFTLSPGAFATVVLDELMKPDEPLQGDGEEEAQAPVDGAVDGAAEGAVDEAVDEAGPPG